MTDDRARTGDLTVSAGDIARLVDVGRAAVSNWRRRHDDFPRPVAGTASNPRFSLAEVQKWLRHNGKRFEFPLADRAWQALRTEGDEFELSGHLVAAGMLLRHVHGGDRRPPTILGHHQARLVVELADQVGPAEAFDVLFDRMAALLPRRPAGADPALAALVGRLVRAKGATVLDPACGTGALLIAAAAEKALGQDADAATSSIAHTRLTLRDVPTDMRNGDSLRHSAFGEATADAVVCDPPFADRGWGHDELVGDPRWVYGLPPRGEPELAWVQHCLSLVRPGGLVAVLMPPVAAARRPGRRIRANLLRAGALRGVVSLPDGPDVWLLRRPGPGDRVPGHVLLLEADVELSTVEQEWTAHLDDPETGSPHRVPVLELLDDDVDVSPAGVRLRRAARDTGAGFAAALARFRAGLPDPPELTVLAEPRALAVTTVADLVKAGKLEIDAGTSKKGTTRGSTPVLTAEDLIAGRPPSGRCVKTAATVTLKPGDVVASATGDTRVITAAGAALGAGLLRYRADRALLDPHFLAGVLRTAARRHVGATASIRLDPRRVAVPRLPPAEQRAYGEAFRRLETLARAVRETAELGEELVELGFGGLVNGRLTPG